MFSLIDYCCRETSSHESLTLIRVICSIQLVNLWFLAMNGNYPEEMMCCSSYYDFPPPRGLFWDIPNSFIRYHPCCSLLSAEQTTVTLQGSEWLSFRVYDDEDHSFHSPTNRVSFDFKVTELTPYYPLRLPTAPEGDMKISFIHQSGHTAHFLCMQQLFIELSESHHICTTCVYPPKLSVKFVFTEMIKGHLIHATGTPSKSLTQVPL